MTSRSAIRAGRADVIVGAKIGPLEKGLKRAQQKLRAFGAGLSRVGTSIATIGVAASTPFIAAIKSASDMQEQMAKFNTVFKENASSVAQWRDQFASSVGRSKMELTRFLASAQDLFVPLGFTSDKAADLSKQITKLTVDLASFNNMREADVFRDLSAALTGSGEVMKKYGVIVSEAAVKQELLKQGLDPTAATNQQKAMARLTIIIRGTTAAQGDAIRTSQSLANQMRRLKAAVSDTAAEVGSNLIPIATQLVGKILSVVKHVSNWVSANPKLITQLAKLAIGVAAAGAAIAASGKAVALAESLANPYVAGLTAITAGVYAAVTAYKIWTGAIYDTQVAQTALYTGLEKGYKNKIKAINAELARLENRNEEILASKRRYLFGVYVGSTGRKTRDDLSSYEKDQFDRNKKRVEELRQLRARMMKEERRKKIEDEKAIEKRTAERIKRNAELGKKMEADRLREQKAALQFANDERMLKTKLKLAAMGAWIDLKNFVGNGYMRAETVNKLRLARANRPTAESTLDRFKADAAFFGRGVFSFAKNLLGHLGPPMPILASAGARGTFSAAAIGAVGTGTDTMSRIADSSRQTARNTRAIKDAIEDGVLGTSGD